MPTTADITPTVDLESIEIWEATTNQSIWLWVEDQLVGKGSWKKQLVGGPNGRKRITLSVKERRWNQEQIPEKNAYLDPFSNGSLVCVQGEDASLSPVFTDAQLIELLAVEDDDAFGKVLENLKSEILVRRIFALSERNAASYRHDEIRDLIDERYRVGYTQRSQRDDINVRGLGNGTLISS